VSADSSPQNDLLNRMSVADPASAVRIACDAATLGAVSIRVSQNRHPASFLVTVQWPSTGIQRTFEAWWPEANRRHPPQRRGR
jgi:hypothetical protein